VEEQVLIQEVLVQVVEEVFQLLLVVEEVFLLLVLLEQVLVLVGEDLLLRALVVLVQVEAVHHSVLLVLKLLGLMV